MNNMTNPMLKMADALANTATGNHSQKVHQTGLPPGIQYKLSY